MDLGVGEVECATEGVAEFVVERHTGGAGTASAELGAVEGFIA